MCKRRILRGLILSLFLAGAAFAAPTLVVLDVSAAPPAGPSDKKDARLKELLQERLAAARVVVKAAQADYVKGQVSFERLHQAMQALLRARLELCESIQERIKVLEEAVALAKDFERNAADRYQRGLVPHSDVLMAGVARLEAEIALERAKGQAPAGPK
jgi:outer membrane protein TolC